MRLDRKMAIEAMRNMGWTAGRAPSSGKPVWKFIRVRADTGGMYNSITRRQNQISLSWVAEIAMRYGDAPELVKEIAEAKERWLKSRFSGVFTRAETNT